MEQLFEVLGALAVSYALAYSLWRLIYGPKHAAGGGKRPPGRRSFP